eukprot:symbB.v1.2.016755.t1/scaffold1279.1/size127165/4
MGSLCSCCCDDFDLEETVVEKAQPQVVTHRLQDFVECRDTVGGHARFLEPKDHVTVMAFRNGQVCKVTGNVILKLAAHNEQAFFEALEYACEALKPFVPTYYGVANVCTNSGALQEYLVLEHVGCSNPAACDIKMGYVQRASHHDSQKWVSMRQKAASSTSMEFGFRPCGLSYYDWQKQKRATLA